MSAPQTAPGTALTVGVVKERAPGERRVACVPDVVPRLTALGAHVLVESGAGLAAWHDDEAYALAGADVVPAATLDTLCDVVLCVQAPAAGPARRPAGGPGGGGSARPIRHPGAGAGLGGPRADDARPGEAASHAESGRSRWTP